MVIVHAHIKVKPEYREEYLETVKDLVAQSQAEEGNISYQLYEQVGQENTFVMVEEWKDESALEYHFETPHFKHFGEVSKKFLETSTQVVKYEATRT